MAGHRPFRTLSDPIMADPVRRARVEEMGRASRILIALARLLDAQCDSSDPDQKASGRMDEPSIWLIGRWLVG